MLLSAHRVLCILLSDNALGATALKELCGPGEENASAVEDKPMNISEINYIDPPFSRRVDV